MSLRASAVTYFPDGAPYTYKVAGAPYTVFEDSSQVICVGWLDAGHPFPTGAVDEDFLAALRYLCVNHQAVVTRGFHECNLGDCTARPSWPLIMLRFDDHEAPLGIAEIRVEQENGVEIAAPTLIYHYVTDHQYRPPDYFVDAVLRQARKISS